MLPQTPFTRNELLDTSITPREWRALAASRQVRELVPGIFVDSELPDTLDLRIAAVRRVVPHDVVIARRTASWLQGLDLLDYRGFPATPPVQVVAERSRRPRMAIVQAHAADDLRARDITEISGMRVTTPLRTASDLARFGPRTDALVAIDAYLNKRLVTKEQLNSKLRRWAGRRGVQQLRTTVELSDLGWLRWRLGLEYDGEEFHGPAQQARDQARRAWIRERGWTVAVFRRDLVFAPGDEFEQVVRKLVNSVR